MTYRYKLDNKLTQTRLSVTYKLKDGSQVCSYAHGPQVLGGSGE